MLKLADRHASGACVSNDVEVQILSSAHMPYYKGECSTCSQTWSGNLDFTLNPNGETAIVDLDSKLLQALIAHHGGVEERRGVCNVMILRRHRSNEHAGYIQVARLNGKGLPMFIGGTIYDGNGINLIRD